MRPVAILDADAAVTHIPDGATVALPGSGGGLLEVDLLFSALEQRFLATGHPRDLCLVHALGIGDGKTRGMNHLAHEGLVRCVISGHYGWSPAMQALARNNKIEAHSWGAGAISTMYREVGAGRPGVFTRIGLHTFVDPRNGGGTCNERTTEPLVELVEIAGREHLWYRPVQIDVALIRASAADEFGNLTLAEEPTQLDTLAAAQAAKASGGQVIAQVKRMVPGGSLDPRLVHVPCMLVDTVVVHPGQWQTYLSEYDPALAGAERIDPGPIEPPRELAKRILAGRAAGEVAAGNLTVFGFGVSSDVVGVLYEQGRLDDITLCIEQGLVSGRPETGWLFGASRNPVAMISSNSMFDTITGRGVDTCVLGMAQADQTGSVNVSHIAGSISGPGGFIDISQSSRHAVFCGTFTARGLQVEASGGRLHIVQEGQIPKFVAAVDAITYSGPFALEEGRRATYVTERAVFELTPEGLELTEVAPGISIDDDILPHMGFTPIIRAPGLMSPALFTGDLPVPTSGGS